MAELRARPRAGRGALQRCIEPLIHPPIHACVDSCVDSCVHSCIHAVIRSRRQAERSPPSWPWPSWRAVTSVTPVTSVTFAAFLALAILASAIRPPLRLDGLLLLLLVLARQRAEALELIDGLPQLLARELLLLGVKALRERVAPPAARKPCTSSPVGIGARSPTWKPTGRLSLDPSRKWS